MAEAGDPVMVVVGGGAIALGAAQELCALQGHRVVVVWRQDPDFGRAVESIGAVHIAAPRPDSTEALDRAGVRHAVTILALSPDDQLNLHAALLARNANPRIRIVLRQFNRTLAHKIELNLPNCSVLSLAWHSAATYAAAAIDPSCFRALQFPEPDGPLTGFATRIAESCGVGGETVVSAERILGVRFLRSMARQRFPATWSSPAGPRWSFMATSPGCRAARRADRPRAGTRLLAEGCGRNSTTAGATRLGSIRFSSGSHWQHSSCWFSALGISIPPLMAAGSTPSILWSRR